MTVDSHGTKAAFARAAEDRFKTKAYISPKVGDLFIVRQRRIPGFMGPFKVTRIGRKFFYLDVGLIFLIEDGVCTRSGFKIESYDADIHGAVLEASALTRWWNDLEGWNLSVNKMRAMKAAYDNVVEFEGEDR